MLPWSYDRLETSLSFILNILLMHLSMLTPRGGGGGSGICGVFDHQLHPHPGDFDQHFGPELGQFEPNDFY